MDLSFGLFPNQEERNVEDMLFSSKAKFSFGVDVAFARIQKRHDKHWRIRVLVRSAPGIANKKSQQKILNIINFDWTQLDI